MDNRNYRIKCPLYCDCGHHAKTEEEKRIRNTTIKCKTSVRKSNIMIFTNAIERKNYVNEYCKCFYMECPEYISRESLKDI